MSRYDSLIKARITLVEYAWVETFMDRKGLTRSEAVREAIRRLHITEDDEVLARLTQAEQEIESLKSRVGRLESELRCRDRQRKQLSRISTVRGAMQEKRELERKLRVLQTALEASAA